MDQIRDVLIGALAALQYQIWDGLTDALARLDTSAWISVVAVLVACIAAVFAKREADAAIRQTKLQEQIHRDSNQPYVWADFRLDTASGHLVRLIVRNEGPTVAEDVRVIFDQPFKVSSGMENAIIGVQERLAAGLPSMPPGRELSWFYDNGLRMFDEESGTRLQYNVTITGRGPHGDMPTLTYPLDLEDMRRVAAPKLGTLHEITQEIQKLGKEIQKLSKSQ